MRIMTERRERADPLRQENYGFPIGQRIRKVGISDWRYRKYIAFANDYDAEYEFVDTKNSTCKLKRGDIAYAGASSSIPKFMQCEFVVVLDRYRIVKYKRMSTFRDYGAVLMVLTGPNKGRVGKAFGCLGSILRGPINNLEEE